jgi:DUF1016 N-terminal domain
MFRSLNKPTKQPKEVALTGYDALLTDVARVVEDARRAAARSVNAVMTTTYWLVGRRIVEQEQQGARRADYGEQVLKRLSGDLSRRFGRGFSERNLEQMRGFYLGWRISQAPPAKSPLSSDLDPPGNISQALPAKSVGTKQGPQPRFPLPWTHYVRVLAVKNAHARTFYETESLRGGWTSRQLDRQIQSQFYERNALSRDKAAMLRKGASAKVEDGVTLEEEIKNPMASSSSISRTSTRRATLRPR